MHVRSWYGNFANMPVTQTPIRFLGKGIESEFVGRILVTELYNDAIAGLLDHSNDIMMISILYLDKMMTSGSFYAGRAT